MLEQQVAVYCKKLVDKAVIPEYAHSGDSGMDLYPTEEFYLDGGDRLLVKTGIAIALPKGYEAQVRPRSGNALKHGLTVVNTPGTIDCGYRGEIGVILLNTGKERYYNDGSKAIAQLVFAPVAKAYLQMTEELPNSDRGIRAYGSTDEAKD